MPEGKGIFENTAEKILQEAKEKKAELESRQRELEERIRELVKETEMQELELMERPFRDSVEGHGGIGQEYGRAVIELAKVETKLLEAEATIKKMESIQPQNTKLN
jgi:phage shock protein A